MSDSPTLIRNEPEKAPYFINLEEGHPSLEEARARLRDAIAKAKGVRLRVLTVVHGYGSTGQGGKLRWGIRRSLGKLRSQNQIGDFLPGEEFNESQVRALVALSCYRFLWEDPNLNRSNKGITFVFLDPKRLNPGLGPFAFPNKPSIHGKFNSECSPQSIRRVANERPFGII
jgi:hypothetical protein